ncbi:MAG: hypothetical protein AAF356_04560 [Planctomycetota bacterium]
MKLARIRDNSVVHYRLGSELPGEPIDLLNRYASWRQRVLAPAFALAFLAALLWFGFLAPSGPRLSTFHTAIFMFWAVWLGASSAVLGGLLPWFYSVTWSPAGLSVELFWRRTHVEPDAVVRVTPVPLVGVLVRPKDGRWFILPMFLRDLVLDEGRWV